MLNDPQIRLSYSRLIALYVHSTATCQCPRWALPIMVEALSGNLAPPGDWGGPTACSTMRARGTRPRPLLARARVRRSADGSITESMSSIAKPRPARIPLLPGVRRGTESRRRYIEPEPDRSPRLSRNRTGRSGKRRQPAPIATAPPPNTYSYSFGACLPPKDTACRDRPAGPHREEAGRSPAGFSCCSCWSSERSAA